jgi:O-acetyl-ADP-ribose deacetylase (regulator of RNase III)
MERRGSFHWNTMNKIVEITGDLLETDAQYIAHQCNCVTTYGKGLSAALFRRFPWADTYTGRVKPSEPGTIQVFGDGKSQHFVVNMYAQYNPGKPKKTQDSALDRQQWFASCLQQIGTIPNLREVAFPSLIGCGLAGGDWKVYSQMLHDWAEMGNYDRVLLVKKD